MDLRISGCVGVSAAPEVHERLTEALAAEGEVAIDLTELVECDLALLQLLVSARASAEARGRALTLSGHGYAFERALTHAGLEHLLEAPWVEAGEKVQFFFFDDEEPA